MSDLNLGNSSIELSDIRKLDILLTQCETSSCENICNDCCARLGSLEDEDDDTSSGKANIRLANNARKSPAKGESAGLPAAEAAAATAMDTAAATSTIEKAASLLDAAVATTDAISTSGRDVIRNVPIISYVTEASTPTLNSDRDDDDDDVHRIDPIPLSAKFAPSSCENVKSIGRNSLRNPPLGSTRKFCSKCGGIKIDSSQNEYRDKRYFSLDTERTAKTASNLLSSVHDERGGSENTLNSCRKHCSFEENCGKSGCKGKAGERNGLKSPPSKKGSHRSDNTSTKSNPLSSQNSLRDNRSRKNSLFYDSSLRSKFSTHPSSKRFSMKAAMGANDSEQDAETREILLGKIPEILKIPEPVEAVGLLYNLFSKDIYCRTIQNI